MRRETWVTVIILCVSCSDTPQEKLPSGKTNHQNVVSAPVSDNEGNHGINEENSEEHVLAPEKLEYDSSMLIQIGPGAYLHRKDSSTYDAVFEPNSSEGIVVEQVKRMAMTKSRFIIEHFDTAAGTLKICAICSGLYGEWRRKCSCCYYPKEFLRDRIHEFYFSELEKRRIRDSMIEVQRVWLNPELVLKP